MELPYVLECGVSAVPDKKRGQIVKASIKLVKGTRKSEKLKKEIQNYVKEKLHLISIHVLLSLLMNFQKLSAEKS